MDIGSKLKEYIETQLLSGRNEHDLNRDTRLFTSHLLDSVDLLDLTTYLEDEFGIKLKPRDIVPENIDTIAAIEHLIADRSEKSLTA